MHYQTIRYRRNRLALPFLDIVCERSSDLGITDDWSTGETVEVSAIPNPGDAAVDDVTERSVISIGDQQWEFLRTKISRR